MTQLRLRPRLMLAASMCAGSGRLIEIGCDHAKLSAFVALNGAQGALACDLRPGPLGRAAKTVEKYRLEQKIELRLSNGLEKIAPGEGDTIAICGMGGELIAGILRQGRWALEGNHRLILQPQSRSAYLRRFLAKEGVKITRECLARDGGKLYCVIEARGGGREYRAENMGMFSGELRGDRLFGEFLCSKIEKYRKITQGRAAGGLDFERDAQILEMLEKYRDAT